MGVLIIKSATIWVHIGPLSFGSYPCWLLEPEASNGGSWTLWETKAEHKLILYPCFLSTLGWLQLFRREYRASLTSSSLEEAGGLQPRRTSRRSCRRSSWRRASPKALTVGASMTTKIIMVRDTFRVYPIFYLLQDGYTHNTLEYIQGIGY